MRTLTLCLLLALLAAPAAAQEHLPILDMHLHAMAADQQGPPPLAMCTSMPFPAWDPSRPYGEAFMALAKAPPCPDPVWSPMTERDTVELLAGESYRLRHMNTAPSPTSTLRAVVNVAYDSGEQALRLTRPT